MKKFLCYCLVAIMLVASVSVVASAAASDWVAGNGFYVHESKNPNNVWDKTGHEAGEKVPVVIGDAAGEMGVSVEHAGYFTTAENWGGVSSVNEVYLDGLEVTVHFTDVPVVTDASDCWIAIDLLENHGTFVTAPNQNPGFVNLIRFATGKIEMFMPTGWGGNGSNPGFLVDSGDTIILKSNYDAELDQYVMVVNHEGTDYPVDPFQTREIGKSVLYDGKGYVTVMASCFGSNPENGFKYTVNVKNGVALPEDVVAAKEAAVANAASVETINSLIASIKGSYDFNSTDEKVVANADAAAKLASLKELADAAEAKKAEMDAVFADTTLDSVAMKAKIDAIVEELTASKAAADALNSEIESIVYGKPVAIDPSDAGAGAGAGTVPGDSTVPGANAPVATGVNLGGTTEDAGFPVVPVVVVVVVVIVVAAVLVVVLKKKK